MAIRRTITNEHRNDMLRAQIKERDMLNLAKLCRRIPYDRGTFSHFVEGNQNLSDDVIDKVETLLKIYGITKI